MEKDSYAIQNKETSAIVSCLGGTITKFNIGNTEIFYPLRAVGNKNRGGCHYCAPWFGSSSMGNKKHGHLRDLTAQGELNINDTSVGFEFIDSKSELYPWDLLYSTIAEVSNDGALKIGLEIKNLGGKINGPAPISPGLHPYFSCKDIGNARVIMGRKKFSGFSEKSNMIFIEDSTVLIQMSDKKIEMAFGDAFMKETGSNIILWTDSKEYVCIEPVLGHPRALNTPGGYFLGKNESITISASFGLL